VINPTIVPTLAVATTAPATLPPATVPGTPATPSGTVTTTSEVVGTPTDTPPPPTLDPSLPADHYWLGRPIGRDGVDYGDRTYAYGSTAGGQYRPHTGIEFRNPTSTPVIAVGNGTVQYAGDDLSVLYGPQNNFYGQLIVLQLTDFSYGSLPIYALYGHLDQIQVKTGDTIAFQQAIGTVGSSGVAIGPHLHFEVRVGDPLAYFSSTRNPDLWIKPYYGYGTLAGKVVDGAGNYVSEAALTLKGTDMVRYTWTYAGGENRHDEAWGENFTLGDLPEGWYTLTTRSSTRNYSFDVYIDSGKTTWLEIVFN
jgi:murein DD-endopeptidase MepM/ murein hydrolase activator NlpD